MEEELKIYRYYQRTKNNTTICYLAARDEAEGWEKFRQKYECIYGDLLNPLNFPYEEVNERLEGHKITIKPLEQKASP